MWGGTQKWHLQHVPEKWAPEKYQRIWCYVKMYFKQSSWHFAITDSLDNPPRPCYGCPIDIFSFLRSSWDQIFVVTAIADSLDHPTRPCYGCPIDIFSSLLSSWDQIFVVTAITDSLDHPPRPSSLLHEKQNQLNNKQLKNVIIG